MNPPTPTQEARQRHNKQPATIGTQGFFYEHTPPIESVGLSMCRNLEVTPTDLFKHDDWVKHERVNSFSVAEIGTNYLKLLPGYVWGKSEEEKAQNAAKRKEQKEIDEFLAKYRGGTPEPTDKRKQNLTAGQKSGPVMSAQIRRKLKTIGTSWINSMIVTHDYIAYQKQKRVLPQYLKRGSHPVFITLTIPGKQMHTDTEIKAKALDRYLRALTWKVKDINYMWVAELQKRGVVHFHIMADRYVHYKWSDSIWNRALRDLGYDTSANTGNKVESIKAHSMPGYLAKYFTKLDLDELQQCTGADTSFKRELGKVEIMNEAQTEVIKTYYIPTIEGRKYGICSRLLTMFKDKTLSAFRVNLYEFHEFRRWLLQRVKSQRASSIIHYSEKCLMIRNSLSILPEFIKTFFWLHFYDIWAKINTKAAQNVQRYGIRGDGPSSWRDRLADVRFNTIYTAPFALPTFAAKPIRANERVPDLFSRPAGH